MRAHVLAGMMILFGCAAARPAAEEAKPMADPKTSTVRGVAQNAKGGAVIVVGDAPIYVVGLDSWPKDLDGKPVTATGIVQSEKYIPSPYRSPDGLISQGAEGNQTTIRDAQYGLAREKWKSGIGSVVTVSGEARQVLNTATIVTSDGPCYMWGMKQWPAEIIGKQISATGHLLRNKRVITAETDDSAVGGEKGEQWALDKAVWSQP